VLLFLVMWSMTNSEFADTYFLSIKTFWLCSSVGFVEVWILFLFWSALVFSKLLLNICDVGYVYLIRSHFGLLPISVANYIVASPCLKDYYDTLESHYWFVHIHWVLWAYEWFLKCKFMPHGWGSYLQYSRICLAGSWNKFKLYDIHFSSFDINYPDSSFSSKLMLDGSVCSLCGVFNTIFYSERGWWCRLRFQ